MKDKEKKMVVDFSKSIIEIKSRRPEDYKEKILLYKGMKNGEDGGEFRSSGTSIRSLHFSKWKDIHFHYLLEVLGEIEEITDTDRKLKFKNNDTIINKMIKFLKLGENNGKND
tara:strand:+ start:176 stop:514 length:339 start_codon:yes stop_codon:yes gene_type:complete